MKQAKLIELGHISLSETPRKRPCILNRTPLRLK